MILLPSGRAALPRDSMQELVQRADLGHVSFWNPYIKGPKRQTYLFYYTFFGRPALAILKFLNALAVCSYYNVDRG